MELESGGRQVNLNSRAFRFIIVIIISFDYLFTLFLSFAVTTSCDLMGL